MYFPFAFDNFQGFKTIDLKESRKNRHIKIILQKKPDSDSLCSSCGEKLGRIRGKYFLEAKHLKICSFTSSVIVPVLKRECETCKKIRSELITFLCPTSPHITMEMAWWISKLTNMSAVLQVSKIESVDKNTCYRVDKFILKKLLQGYKIPKITHISVDEVYTRSKKQIKKDETRDDLFMTVILDLKTRKAIWVAKSRRKEALDEFFNLIGKDACKEIKVVATDQHKGYGESVREHCKNAKLVWDRFHLVQSFNEAVNNERQEEFIKLKAKKDDMMELVRGKYKYLFLSKHEKRSKEDKEHLVDVLTRNKKLLSIDLIKERFHRMFKILDKNKARETLNLLWDWADEAGAEYLKKYFWNLMDREEFLNYFENPFTTSVSEGLNRVIKGLKWQAYGYKDMTYFALKILQKCGYLNWKHALNEFNT